jgi:hypothetical protein
MCVSAQNIVGINEIVVGVVNYLGFGSFNFELKQTKPRFA